MVWPPAKPQTRRSVRQARIGTFAIEILASLIAGGMPDSQQREELANRPRKAILGRLGTRYRADTEYAYRNAFMAGNDALSFAGLVDEDSRSSGVYGGVSLIWFPRKPAKPPPSEPARVRLRDTWAITRRTSSGSAQTRTAPASASGRTPCSEAIFAGASRSCGAPPRLAFSLCGTPQEFRTS